MATIKDIRAQMREKGVNEASSSKYLRLGTKVDGGGVKSTGKHVVKLLADPTIEKGKHFKTGVERQELVFRLEEDGDEKSWSIALYKLDNKGNAELGENGKPIENYLISSLEDIKVGEAFSLELKAKGGRNYIEVVYPIVGETQEVFSASNDGIDPSDF